MDETRMRQAAEAHGAAVVAGDMETVLGDIDPALHGQAPQIVQLLPNPVEAAEVRSVTTSGDGADVEIAYSGGGQSVTLHSRWVERDGRLTIVAVEPRP